MEKTLRLLGLFAILGATAIVIAQHSSARAANTGGQQSAPAASSQSGLPSNNVLTLLSMYFCSKQALELEKANLQNRHDLTQPIIKANCASILTLLTPDQQKAHIKSWAIEQYAPNDRAWDEVVRTPSLVNHLLKVSKKVDDVAYKAIDDVWRPGRERQQELDKQIIATPEWKAAKTKHERNIVHYNWMQEYRKKVPLAPLIERHEGSVAAYKKVLPMVRNVLSKEERAEWDMLINRFEDKIGKAATSRVP